MKYKLMFHQEAKDFINSILRQRKYLITQKLSNIYKSKMKENVNFLELHLRANYYNSDKKMAGFLLRHKAKIRNIIPGEPHKANASQIEKLEDLLIRARMIFSNNISASNSFNSSNIRSYAY